MSVRSVALPSTNNGDLSQATVTIGPFDVRSIPAAAVQIGWSGSPVGTLQLQGTTGQPTQSSNQANTWPGPWAVIGSPVSLPLSTGGTSQAWDLAQTGMSAVQVVYTRTSGTGTVTLATGQQKT